MMASVVHVGKPVGQASVWSVGRLEMPNKEELIRFMDEMTSTFKDLYQMNMPIAIILTTLGASLIDACMRHPEWAQYWNMQLATNAHGGDDFVENLPIGGHYSS